MAAVADFLMPALGADMVDGTVVQWLVAAGAHVHPGDVVAVVETHKGAIDCEIFLDGVIEDLVPVGTQLRVGEVLARVRTSGEAVAAPVTARPIASPPPPPAATRTPAAPPDTAAASPSMPAATRKPVSPAARRRAQALGIDPGTLAGTGVDGSVTLADVELAATRPRATRAPAPASTSAQMHGGFDPAAMRQAIGAAMSRSKREIPHYYLTQAIDFQAASDWLAAWNADHAPQDRLLPAVLLLKATALALARHPQLNGWWVDGALRPGAGVHVGWAIAMRGGGLMAPALHDADRPSLPVLMARMRDLVQRVRSGGVRSSEMTDPTVTITSVGERGADSVLGVIYPPQVALVGFGRIAQRPWVADGALGVRAVVVASLAADHRASDGHLGGQLLSTIDTLLQSPQDL